MYILRKLLIAAITIGVFEGLKLLFDSISPASVLFHRQFLLVLQVATGIWFLFLLILFAFRRQFSWTARFLPVLIILLVITMDMWFTHLLNHPDKIPRGLLSAYREYYEKFERKDLYYEPCTVFDSLQGPMIIPGLEFVYGNIEYQNQYRVNSASFRDNEQALFGPRIVFTGGTFTFGCGVDSALHFPALISKRFSNEVLNAASIFSDVASPLEQLAKADTSIVEHFICQYPSDIHDTGRTAHISFEKYDLQRRRYNWSREYFPGKVVISVLFAKIASWFASPVQSRRIPTVFLDTLSFISKRSPARFIIIVPDKPSSSQADTGMLIQAVLNTDKYAELRDRATIIDCSKLLTDRDFYILDEHMNAIGHRKLTDAITKKLEEARD